MELEIFQSYQQIKSDRNQNHPISKEDLRRRRRAVKEIKVQFSPSLLDKK